MVKYFSLSFLMTLASLTHSADALKMSDFKAEGGVTCTAKKLDTETVTYKYENSLQIMEKTLLTKPDFAGHYYFVELPTPKGDVYNYTIIDCLTGKEVASLPQEYVHYSADNYTNGYISRRLPTSRLLIMEGTVTDPKQANLFQTEYYEMKDGVLKLIKKTRPEIAKPQ